MSNECNYHHLDGNSDLKQKPKKLTKTCKVCGGQAYGKLKSIKFFDNLIILLVLFFTANKVFFNYSGLSCESCN